MASIVGFLGMLKESARAFAELVGSLDTLEMYHSTSEVANNPVLALAPQTIQITIDNSFGELVQWEAAGV